MNWFMVRYYIDLWFESRSFKIDEFWRNAQKVQELLESKEVVCDYSVQAIDKGLYIYRGTDRKDQRWLYIESKEKKIWLAFGPHEGGTKIMVTMPSKMELYEINYVFADLVKTYCPE